MAERLPVLHVAADQQVETAGQVDDLGADAPADVFVAPRGRHLEFGPAARAALGVGERYDVAGEEIAARAAQLIDPAADPRIVGPVADQVDEGIQVLVAEVIGQPLGLGADQLLGLAFDDARGQYVGGAEHGHHRRGEHQRVEQREARDRRAGEPGTHAVTALR